VAFIGVMKRIIGAIWKKISRKGATGGSGVKETLKKSQISRADR
jgi:hypothetical protein